jgi:diguanylate cyclase (GGDEF)-like protein
MPNENLYVKTCKKCKKFFRLGNPIASLYIVTVIVITILTGHHYFYIEDLAEHTIGGAHTHEETLQEQFWILEIYVGLLLFVTAVYFIVAKQTKKMEAKLLKEATYDSLTGLPNRTLLNSELTARLEHAKKTGTQLGLFFIDLDDFKQVNDTYNHLVGDQLLAQVASRFRDILREDDFVARLGGDEFVVITNNADIPPRSMIDVERIAQQIHNATTDKIVVDGIDLYSNSSIGIAVYPCSASTESDLLRAADLAMYECKQRGKNQHTIYTEEIEEGILADYELTQAIRTEILEHKCENFYMVYQPQFSPSKQQVIGFEALIRWEHVDFGHITTDKFISIVEKLKLIDNLGECAIDEVLEEYSAFRKNCKDYCPHFGTHPCKISINMSAMQFNEDLPDKIYCKLLKYGIDPTEVIIEITESTLVEEMHESDIIEKLTNLGIGVSIDDFGTGYSSLKKLSTMPFSSIKIDKSFIDQIGNDIRGEAVILMILILGQELNVTIVAEGVETNEQLAFLRQHCPDIIVQGYLYSEPVTIENLNTVCGALRNTIIL